MSSSVFDNLQTLVGAPYNKLEHNRDIIDTYLLRKAREKGIRLPTGSAPDEFKYHGAHVQIPRAGINENVIYVDVSSMYPNGIRGLNASLETLIGTEQDLCESQWSEEDCVWSYVDARPVKHLEPDEDWKDYTSGHYKIVYDPRKEKPQKNGKKRWSVDDDDNDHSVRYEKLYFLKPSIKEGFLPDCVDDLIGLKNQYRGTPLYGSTKRVTNSIYGVLGFANESSAFRLFSWQIAEAITLYGRKMIKWTRDKVLEYIEDEHPDAYAALGDTDGMGICLPSASTRHEAYTAVEEAVEWLEAEGYDEFMKETFNIEPHNHYAGLDVESYAPRVFVPADTNQPDYPHTDIGSKKRYSQHLTIEDGEEEDEIDITGLEHQRSDVAPITKDAQWSFFNSVLRKGHVTAQEEVFSDLREKAQLVKEKQCDLSYVAKNGGISQPLSEYGSSTRKPAPIYCGAKYAHEYIDGVDISAGSKVQLAYIDHVKGDYPSQYSSDTGEDGRPIGAVAMEDITHLPDEFVIDWDKHWRKTLKKPMQNLLKTLGWNWDMVIHNQTQSGLDAFA